MANFLWPSVLLWRLHGLDLQFCTELVNPVFLFWRRKHTLQGSVCLGPFGPTPLDLLTRGFDWGLRMNKF